MSVKMTKTAFPPPLRRSSSRRARHFATRLRKERPTFAVYSLGDSAFSQIGSSRSRREAPPAHSCENRSGKPPQCPPDTAPQRPLADGESLPFRSLPRTMPPMKRDENTLPSAPSSGTSSALGTPFPPLRRTAERFPVRPAAFNAFHHVHSPPLIIFFRRRPLRFRTRRCPCGRTCAVFYQNRCTFFQ